MNRLIDQGVLEKINDVSSNITWTSPIVHIEKPNRKLRIYGDFKISLNKYIDYLPYPLPTFNDIIEKIKGGTLYSVIDLKDAYL